MRIGIVSDSHGNTAMVLEALDRLRERGIRTVLHCGDIDDPATVHLFEAFATHFVFGNCDGDRSGIRRAIAVAGLTLHEPFGKLELAGKKIAFLHGSFSHPLGPRRGLLSGTPSREKGLHRACEFYTRARLPPAPHTQTS